MMGKRLQLLLVVCAGIFGLLAIARITGIIQVYEIPTSANEPKFKKNNKILTSNLKTPSRGDFITFINPYSDTFFVFTNRATSISEYIYRFCAAENDTLKMNQGVLFVNGKNSDTGLNLSHYYMVNKRSLPVLQELDSRISADVYNDYRIGDTATIVNLSDAIAKEIAPKVSVVKYRMPADTGQFGIFMWKDNNHNRWTTDDFGPLVVPRGYCFVLGDNRNVALDSRYVGFIKLSNIKGVKL